MKRPIAIASYDRPQTIVKKTLRMLDRYGLADDRVTVFVANQEEYRRYAVSLHSAGYRGTLTLAAEGIVGARNFITDHYGECEEYVSIDDDVEGFLVRVNEKKAIELDDLGGLIDTGFSLCEKSGANLWGVYPVKNPYFMRDEVTYDLRYIEGSFWGCRNRKLSTTMPTKEDFERTIKYYLRDGKVVRINNVAFKTRFWDEPGGLQAPGQRTRASHDRCVMEMLKRYPDLCRTKRRRDGSLDLAVADRRRR